MCPHVVYVPGGNVCVRTYRLPARSHERPCLQPNLATAEQLPAWVCPSPRSIPRPAVKKLIFIQFSYRSRVNGASAVVNVDWQVVGPGSARGYACCELCSVTVWCLH